MKKILVTLLLTAGMLVGCQKEETPAAEQCLSTTNRSPHVVTVEQAKENLNALLSELDGGDKTRAGGIRQITTMEKIPGSVFVNTRTRAGEEETEIGNVEELLYVANLDKGFAILGADDRVRETYAIADHGTLTAADFARIAAMTPQEAVVAEENGEFVAPLRMVAMTVAADFTGGMSNGLVPLDPNNPPEPPKYWHKYAMPWKVKYYFPIQIPDVLCMGQDYPLNQYTPNQKLAGCGAVAVAQLFMANFWGRSHCVGDIGGTPIDWDRLIDYIGFSGYPGAVEGGSLESVRSGKSPMNPNVQELARFVAACGRNLDSIFSGFGTATFVECIDDLLRENGYQGADNWQYRMERVSEMLALKQLPLIMYGDDGNVFHGHYWVLDGYMGKEQKVYTYYYNADPTTSVNYQHYVHCNWGQYGDGNGWYDLSAFDTDTQQFTDGGMDREVDRLTRSNYNSRKELILYNGLE